MSFDTFSPDPNPPRDPQRHEAVVAEGNRRLARRRAITAALATFVVVAAVLPLALRDSGDSSDVRADGRTATQPTNDIGSSVPLATVKPPDESTTTTTTVLRRTEPPVVSPTTAPKPATPCEPRTRVEPVNRGRILFTRQPNEGARPARVFSVNADGSDVKQLTDGDFDTAPTWSPDGSRIAFLRNAQLHVMNADGTDVRRLTDGPEAQPTWSPDGTQIAFQHQGPFAVMLVNADGSGLKVVLVTGDRSPNSPSWTPDSCRLIFDYCCVREHGLWSVRTDGSGLKQLRTTGYFPAVGPDGRIVFGETNPSTGQNDFYVSDPDGTNAKSLGQIGGRPTWSPDGSRIAFERWIGGAWNIASMAADGSDVRAVTTTSTAADLYAAW